MSAASPLVSRHIPRHTCLSAPAHSRVLSRRAVVWRASNSGHGEVQRDPSSEEDGSPDVREALADILQVEVRRVKAKEELLEELKSRKDGLRRIGNEMIEKLDKENELNKLRTELASNSSLADTQQQFSEIEQQIEAVKRQLQADKADLAAWERTSASRQNRGLFFKSLYKPPDSSQPVGLASRSQDLKHITDDIRSSAGQEARSPLRLYLFSYLAIVLGAVVILDIASGKPSYFHDGTYIVLGVLLGVNAWNERQGFVQQGEAISRKQQGQQEKWKKQQQHEDNTSP